MSASSASTTGTASDPAAVEAFAERLVETLNQGATALMLSLGHRTRLFDRMAELAPATSERIAERAGLDERYVREWLGAMVTARIVRYDPAAATYELPAEHAACLTRAAEPNNIASLAQYVPLLAAVEDQIVGCFEHGGGVPYSEFKRFHEVMAEDSGQTVVGSLLDSIVPLVPELDERLTAGIDVLDVGCGSGRALVLLGRTFPASRFTGYDFSEEGIARAEAEATQAGLTNVRFEVRDVAALDGGASFDLVTAFDAIHDQADPAGVLAGIRRRLRPDGVFLMQDIHASSHLHHNLDHPLGPFLYTISTMHCMTVSLAAGGAGLGTVWGQELALEMLAAAGFSSVQVHRLDHDIQNSYYVARP